MGSKQFSNSIEQIHAYAKTLVQSVRLLDERRYILAPLVENKSIKEALGVKFTNTYGAHAYNHLVPLISQDLVRDISRVFLDEGRKACSFVNLYRKSSEKKVLRRLRANFKHIPDKWHENPVIGGLTARQSESIIDQMRDNDREDFMKSFDEGWGIVSEAIENISSDIIGQKIKTFRDKYHAHLEMTPLGQDPGPFDVGALGLSINDLFNFLDRYIPAIFELSRIITGSVHDVEGFCKAHSRHGLDMWCVLSGIDFDTVKSEE